MALSSVYYFPFPEGAAKSGPRCIGPSLSRGFAKEESVASGIQVPGAFVFSKLLFEQRFQCLRLTHWRLAGKIFAHIGGGASPKRGHLRSCLKTLAELFCP